MKTKISDCGDLMSLDRFVRCCEAGGFIDYDGYGYYSDGELMTDRVVLPSHVKEGTVDKSFTHVVWFNR